MSEQQNTQTETTSQDMEQLVECCSKLEAQVVELITGKDVRSVAIVLSRLGANAIAQTAHAGAKTQEEVAHIAAGMVQRLYQQALESASELEPKVSVPDSNIITSAN